MNNSIQTGTGTVRHAALTILLLLLSGGSLLLRAQQSATDQAPASSSKGSHPTTEQLVRQSEVIAVGKVSTLQSDWNNDHTRISTAVTLNIGEYLKGSQAGTTLSVTFAGGEIGSVGELYSETARFRKNEEVVVFVAKDASGAYRVTGGMSGKYSITNDVTTNRKMVSASLSLDDFTAQVKRIIASQVK